jgi:hypothetical protein
MAGDNGWRDNPTTIAYVAMSCDVLKREDKNDQVHASRRRLRRG